MSDETVLSRHNLSRDEAYEKLRNLDISPEVSDAVASKMEVMGYGYQAAILMWISGWSQKDAATNSGIRQRDLSRAIDSMRH